MNTYKCSDGTRVTQSQIDARIRKTKAQLVQNQFDEYGYNFCTKCCKNDCKPIDCSHNVSVKDCKEQGRTELAWNINNMELIGRIHHKEKDGLNLQFKNK